ncbi:SusD/RagB family nutrient-binding outer membrane lipoprotein [Sinomicrobium soli]|uniref:SusD/RagB family nutrient-binding outer membrane lipoprotein n=1 Tax=Sinomicrobium sp. N-1-3-6 TaxID=2219864 RepID=UPI000DCD2F1C|nr:SusD/RagB family nutrient-binding outer membrane lipoprotein [Sinomicrobium sp. N-1-3-6]RAV30796.1 SusD/RagB family nutrient-binding outer membrane lipoprotein [Sinomicrobium sp. N-1-3-6]
MIKNTVYFVFAVVFSLLNTACEKDFEEINTNDVDPTEVDPVFLFNNAVIGTSFATGQLKYDAAIVQQLVTPNSGLLTGGNHNQDNRFASAEVWDDYYETVIKNTGDLMSRIQDDPQYSNLLQMTRIIQAFTFMVLTDSYGDIPYSEAGKGISDQIVLPAYDPQQEIYSDLIKEVKEAVAALDDNGNAVTGEILYGGDLGKWRKMGNSLLLRLGIHIINADETLARQTVEDAFAGGVMTSNEDNYVIRHDSNFTNPIGNFLNGSEANNFYLVDTFVDFLANTDDPRLGSIAVRYVGAASGTEQVPANASTDPADQIGMPMGHDNSTIGQAVSAGGLASFYDFSQADRTRMVKIGAPMYLVTHAQTRLLLAEAATYGWVSGDPATYFEEGVRAHMELMAEYDPGSAIPAADIDQYIADHPYGGSLEQLYDQYWVACFLNGPEAYANFRRTGYPDLAPNPYPGQDITGEFIRRITYPSAELAVNGEHISEAVSRMGPDNLDTRVWWDQ